MEREGIAKSVVQFIESTTNSGEFPFKPEYMKLDPDYIDKLTDLISRLVNRPHETGMLPRFTDVVCYEYLLKGQSIVEAELQRYTGDVDPVLLAKLTKNVVRFYLESTSIDTRIYDSLLDF